MKRRKFITLLGSAAAWPLAARAQQPAMPVIGFLSSRSPGDSAEVVAGFRTGLSEAGFVEGENAAVAPATCPGMHARLSQSAIVSPSRMPGVGLMRRREFLGVLGGAAAAWPFAARAQQQPTVTIGYLSPSSPASVAHLLALLRRILAEAGYAEGRNLAIEYRFAEGQYERLPVLAAELVRRQVAVLVATPTPAALAAKAVTTTIPIVFSSQSDPVRLGLVASLARPSSNMTGIYFINAALEAKKLGLLYELLPKAKRVGLLVNPDNSNVEEATKGVTAAASSLGIAIDAVRANDREGIEIAFATLVHNRADALLVVSDAFFYNQRLLLATLATRHLLPVIGSTREYPEAGGLMSYGTGLTEVYQQLGTYTARILKGEKPADLPVVQSTKFELVINIPTARALGLEIPTTLLGIADDVIE
jgi:putative ABC transport system substrate-binding protein